VVSIRGRLERNDHEGFKTAVSDIQAAIVFLDSPGGFLTPAMSIGLMIKRKKFETAVADGIACNSACALIWLAGNPRLMAEGAHIGFHSSQELLHKDEYNTAVGNGYVGYYLKSIELPWSAVLFVLKANPQSLSYLTQADSLKYEIGYSVLTRVQSDPQRDSIGGRIDSGMSEQSRLGHRRNVCEHLAAWDAQHTGKLVSEERLIPNSLNRPSMEVRNNCPSLTSHVPADAFALDLKRTGQVVSSGNKRA
jgi:hypothetical protein